MFLVLTLSVDETRMSVCALHRGIWRNGGQKTDSILFKTVELKPKIELHQFIILLD